MKIQVRTAGSATILDLDGPLKLGPAQEQFRDQVQKLMDAGSTHIAINLAGVTDLDSSGIGAFVRAYTSLTKAGGKCRFFAAPKFVMQTLHMVRLDTVFDIAEDEASALARF